jgi:hypothetical protein
LILDGRNLYDPERLRRLGFEYHSIGRPVAVPAPIKPSDLPLRVPLPVKDAVAVP